jgi:hypothetical protein
VGRRVSPGGIVELIFVLRTVPCCDTKILVLEDTFKFGEFVDVGFEKIGFDEGEIVKAGRADVGFAEVGFAKGASAEMEFAEFEV